jgi:hypothetical protein
MKAHLLKLSFVIAGYLLLCNDVISQASLEPDQNPNYAISRDKYMKMADSLNEWHSTTFQNTYKAKDYMQDRADARMARREYRRQYQYDRMSVYGYNDYYNGYYYPSNRYYRGNYYPYNNYNNNYYYRDRYNRHHPRYTWGLSFWWP